MLPNDYWESNDERRDQKFYASFCMLEAACSDYAIGVKLKRQKCLNWACTAFYYSMVHAARLICFVETGDFPTAHNQLGRLFSDGRLARDGNTWVKMNQHYLSQVDPMSEFNLVGLSPNNRERLGQILDKAQKLRNDANYEGLLISHEYSHEKVTKSFRRLAIALQNACESLLPDMIGVFKDFVDSSPRNNYWYAFLNWKTGHNSVWSVSEPTGEGLYYLEASLKYRGVGKRAIVEVSTWLEDLKRESDLDVRRAREVHSHIVRSEFAIKDNLMRDFETKINEFETATGQVPRTI